MKATDTLPAVRIPHAASSVASRTGVAPPFAQGQRRRRKSRRQHAGRPSRGAMLCVLFAVLFAFGVVTAFVVVALGV